MKPEIRRYLEEHAATYTPEALRRALLDAGYDPVEVDGALRDWQGDRAGIAASEAGRRTFGRWALWLHLGALVAMVVLLVILNGTQALGLALIGAVVLGIFLALGWAVSSLIGRALLPRAGLPVALILPAITALGLGGTCLAIMDGMIPTPATPGIVELQIDPPSSFQGSGPGNCFIQTEAGAVAREAAFGINAENLGTLDGRVVSISLDAYQALNTDATPNVSIGLSPTSGTLPAAAYGNRFDTRLELDLSADMRSGTVTFENLASEPAEAPGSRSDVELISGTVTWTCE